MAGCQRDEEFGALNRRKNCLRIVSLTTVTRRETNTIVASLVFNCAVDAGVRGRPGGCVRQPFVDIAINNDAGTGLARERRAE